MLIDSFFYEQIARWIAETDRFHIGEDRPERAQMAQKTPALIYAKYTLGFTLQYTDAVNIHIPGWNEDIFKSNFICGKNIADDIDG